MARPRKYPDRVSTAVRLPVELHRALTEAAAERGVPVNYLVTRAVAELLPRLRPTEGFLVIASNQARPSLPPPPPTASPVLPQPPRPVP